MTTDTVLPNDAAIDTAREALEALEAERRAGLLRDAGKRPAENPQAGGTARNLAAELYAEAQAEAGGGDVLGEMTVRPADIWTLDRMRERKPLPGDLYGDGKFLFEFKPVLGTVYCQERYAIAREYVEGDFQSYMRMQKAYAEIVRFAIVSWPVRETLDDPATGKPLYEADGVTPQSVPLPPTQDNINRLDLGALTDFLLAMQRAVEGEASTTP